MAIVQMPWYKKDNLGRRLMAPVLLEVKDGRIWFIKSDRAFKDVIKAMTGSKWHGYDEENPKRQWSVTDCQRNWITIRWQAGEDVFAHFDQELRRHQYDRPLMPHQRDLADGGLTYHYQIFAAEMGTGKGGLPSTKVATPTGWTTLGEIQVGDQIINPDGGVTRVKGVYHRGRMEMFRVTFSDGATTVCSADHLWNVRTAVRKWRGMSYETLELREIQSRGLHDVNGNAKHYIPMTAPVEYEGSELPLPPYLVGYLLGNGGLSGWTNVVSIPDQETVDRLNGLMGCPLHPKSRYDYIIKDPVVNAWIDSENLKGCRSHEKHLPEAYLWATVENRLELLRGLCDADGHATATGGVEYSTTSANLRDAFVTLVQSLGGTCSVAEKHPTYTYQGEQREGRLAYRIYASLPSSIVPFRLRRKVNDYIVPTKYEPTRAIVGVQSIGEHECICIQVEAANQLYVTDDFIVTHNTLAAQEVMERSGVMEWWWVGPKTSLPNIQRELRKWGFSSLIHVEFMTYEGMTHRMDEWKPGDPIPQGVIYDESSKLKNHASQRSKAAQKLADLIREKYGYEGYVILMSGTPSPKTPVDWWSQCEIAWPGFLAEGSEKAFRERLAFTKPQTFDSGVTIKKLEGWRDDERKCKKCGEYADHANHQPELCDDPENYHPYEPSINEVALLHDRLKGLVIIKHKKDCLTLPDKRYRRVFCKPTASILRVAKALAESAQNTVTGMTLMRELSDGFQYREVQVGTTKCTHCAEGKVEEWFDPDNPDRTYRSIDILDAETAARLHKHEVVCPACGGSCEVAKYVRETREVPCPKDAALKLLLEENEEQGRIVIFAGFTGSVDRCERLCREQGWDVVKCDGRGFTVLTHDGAQVTDEAPLDYWANLASHPRVAFVAHPESGGMSLTLTEARTAVYWSNSWKPEFRIQSEDRVHRIGADMNKGVLIVDLIHLPSDERVLDVIRANRKLELMTMGEIMEGINWEEPDEEADDIVMEETT